MNPLRIAIIGCGKIADQHVLAIRRIPNCEIAAVCDREELMAAQLAERFKIPGVFSDGQKMLENVSPDVVHIVTPPQGHFALAKQCLESGSHVYLEKPFTVTAPEAEELIRVAEKCGRIITAGHNYQFTLEMLRMRKLVAAGYLGGKAVHLESHWAYHLSDASYVGPLLGNRNHWVRQLPGKLFHNLISHGIARLAEFLDDDLVEITASAHQSAQLTRMGGQEVLDELRVTIRDRSGTTGYFCFSTQIKPAMNGLRVCGLKNSLIADASSGSLIRFESKASKSYLTYFLPPLRLARQYFRNGWINVTDFMRGRLHQDAGMKELIEQFYHSIQSHGAPPIPYREILLTARIMDEIFAQVYSAQDGVRTALPENLVNGLSVDGRRSYTQSPA
ncbi:MAG TPA: Gfo/Idh/MocA family oxidoreductase [Verrucomicrobiae bacterium]|jgi:predicted dehydrogenase|nr:Gfo/Idh/MocA family oxidoreductase [Verrucomicrobiae bacterium]